VEDIRDLLALESTGQYRGKYHVLGGVISPMDGIGPNDLNIDTLVQRLEQYDGANTDQRTEVIFALPATMEGETTAFYLFRKLANSEVEVTAIARGLAVGEDLQHADEATLVQSLKQRLPYTS
jgi:recombination protein RecR